MHAFSLTQLRHFVALADTGSFTVAAGATYRSQAAFSRSIAVLEQGLGVLLVDRAGHANELTPVGQALLERARHVLAEADELALAADNHGRAARLQLRVGLGSTPSAMLSAPLLADAAAFPGARQVTITHGLIEMQLQALRERKLDALVMELTSVPAATDLLIEGEVRLPTGFVCRAGHPLLKVRRPSLADIARYPIAGTEISPDVARKMVARFGTLAHPSELLSLRSEDVPSLLALAAASDVIYMGVIAAARRPLAEGVLRTLRFDAAGFESGFGLVRLNGRTEPSGLAVLRRVVQQHLRA